MNISTKIFTIDEQIEFINKTRLHLEKNPDSEIQLGADLRTIDLLRSIEMNLITTKAWVTLPHYHQAAMHVLDKAFQISQASPAADLVNQGKYIITAPEGRDLNLFESLEELAALSLISVAYHIVPLRQVKEVNNG